jgi:hypothetical protein
MPKQMSEDELLSRCGSSPRGGRLQEVLVEYFQRAGMDDTARIIQWRLDTPSDDDCCCFCDGGAAPFLQQYRHKVCGTIYSVIGDAELQIGAGFQIDVGCQLVIYRDDDGKLWARPTSEFHDGRFEAVK